MSRSWNTGCRHGARTATRGAAPRGARPPEAGRLGGRPGAALWAWLMQSYGALLRRRLARSGHQPAARRGLVHAVALGEPCVLAASDVCATGRLGTPILRVSGWMMGCTTGLAGLAVCLGERRARPRQPRRVAHTTRRGPIRHDSDAVNTPSQGCWRLCQMRCFGKPASFSSTRKQHHLFYRHSCVGDHPIASALLPTPQRCKDLPSSHI